LDLERLEVVMDYVPDLVGAALIIMTAIVAVETNRIWLKRLMWAAFVLLVVAQTGFQIRARRIEQARAGEDRVQYRIDRDGMMGLLQGGQKVMNLIVGELQDIRRDIRTRASSSKPVQQGFGQGHYGEGG
jgi:hypothetical protein